MSAYEELVERCAKAMVKSDGQGIKIARFYVPIILAEVLRTLETVTPEMLNVAIYDDYGAQWLLQLRASPLTPS